MKKTNFILNAVLIAFIVLLLTLINKSPKIEKNTNTVLVTKTTDPSLKVN